MSPSPRTKRTIGVHTRKGRKKPRAQEYHGRRVKPRFQEECTTSWHVGSGKKKSTLLYIIYCT